VNSQNWQLFPETHRAVFNGRPNRFVVECAVDGADTAASLPNPGRMTELLYPGVELLVIPARGETAKLPWKVVGAFRDGRAIMLDTHKTNRLVEACIDQKLLPGLESARIIRREVTHGHSRFDFLLKHGSCEVFLEVKSCTLFGGSFAMFPDATTTRGRRHVQELSSLKRDRRKGMIIFVVQWDRATHFLPDYHTDPAFSQALYRARKSVELKPFSVGWSDRLMLTTPPKLLPIPWQVVEREARDRGSYLLILESDRDRTLRVGKLGGGAFPKGFFIYVGSAMQHLEARIHRHQRLRKRLHWHVDHLRAKTRLIQDFPIRSADDLECELAESLSQISDWSHRGFGCSDCDCDTHLFGFTTDPRERPEFLRVLLHYRMGRLSRLL
jgi:sugar fermentation stimulation protein A